jgi:formylglycine-generating enzyme required for sulfatase activity
MVIERTLSGASMLCVLAGFVALSQTSSAESDLGFKDCPVCPAMVVIPPGEFMMGSAATETGRTEREGPFHRASVREWLAIGKYEVSFAEWDNCVAEGGCKDHHPNDEGWGRTRRPVINVSWNDAIAYVVWLSAKTAAAYRLLSETEWEYAARAGTTETRYWGDTSALACEFGNTLDWSAGDLVAGAEQAHECDDGHATTAPVGSYAANGFGLHDMIGNVSEWVEDCWFLGYVGGPVDGSARSRSRGGNPIEPTARLSPGDCNKRGHRGGGWNSGPDDARSASRAGHDRNFRGNSVGFRVARRAP